MAIKNYIPNLITLLNLFCGSIAVIFAAHNNFIAAAIFVFLGIFFDFFDGLLARKLNVQSDLGIQLDSLADMVTSGLVPGVVMFKLISISLDAPDYLYNDDWSSAMHWFGLNFSPLALIGFFITLASGYRLAKFNIDEDQQTFFKGLPTPANTLMILSLPMIIELQHSNFMNALILNTWFLIGLTFLSCYLLNSSVKLFALKFKTYKFADNIYRYLLVFLSIVLLIWLHFIAIPIIIVLYILLSLMSNSAERNQQKLN